jgi:hypothetical protein
MGKTAQIAEVGERAWWLRTLLALQAPRAVFRALRDGSPAAESARQEPVTALVFLAGVAVALRAGANAELLDDRDFDGTIVAVWTVAAGGVQGLFGYWILGAALFAGMSAVGEPGTYRHARHVLAYALPPVVLSLLVVWPPRLALDGGDVFRAGEEDGAAALALTVVEVALYVWSAALLVVAVHVVRGFGWGRSLAATGVAAGVLLGAFAAFWLAA